MPRRLTNLVGGTILLGASFLSLGYASNQIIDTAVKQHANLVAKNTASLGLNTQTIAKYEILRTGIDTTLKEHSIESGYMTPPIYMGLAGLFTGAAASLFLTSKRRENTGPTLGNAA